MTSKAESGVVRNAALFPAAVSNQFPSPDYHMCIIYRHN